MAGPRRHDVLDFAGRTDLAGLAEVLAGADVVVVGNTGPAHLAAAVGPPVVSLFAPTVPAVRWRPWRVPHVLLGARPILASDGQQALEILQRQRPPAILCDLLMPGMDGLAFARHLHAHPEWARIPIIAVTALGGVADYIRTWSHGFQAHLTKPVTIEDLAGAVRCFTARPRPSR